LVNGGIVRTEKRLLYSARIFPQHGIIQTFFDFGFGAEACVPWPAGWSGNVGCLGGGISGMFAGFCDASDPAQQRTKWMLNSTAFKSVNTGLQHTDTTLTCRQLTVELL